MSDQPTPEERQEALSHRYVDAARVVGPLASGRYAIQTMARGQIIGMAEPAELPPAIIEACAASSKAWELAKAEEAAWVRSPPPAVVVVPGAASAEELGL